MPKHDLAIVGDPMEAVIAATALRRRGLSVVTYLSGNEKRQRKRAMTDARKTLTPNQARHDMGRVFDALGWPNG